MKTHKNLYPKIYDLKNLILAHKKARKHKTKKRDVKEFEENLAYNLKTLHDELKAKTYSPKPLKTFILRDPKTRKISKSDYRDRVVHHALCNIIEPIFEKTFIYDSYANRKNKGTLNAIKRFDLFKRKVSGNGTIIKNKFNDSNFVYGFCLKADIKHYFQRVNHEILLNLIKRKISDKDIIWLINRILKTNNLKNSMNNVGMPLGNLTSQFFANIYLNELDYFVKHTISAKYYLRYVDDFVILHKSKFQLESWKNDIIIFLGYNLKLKLHPEKSKIYPLSRGIDFLGFRTYYHFRLLRRRNIRSIHNKLTLFRQDKISSEKFNEIYQGWQAYAKWADTYNIRKRFSTQKTF